MENPNFVGYFILTCVIIIIIVCIVRYQRAQHSSNSDSASANNRNITTAKNNFIDNKNQKIHVDPPDTVSAEYTINGDIAVKWSYNPPSTESAEPSLFLLGSYSTKLYEDMMHKINYFIVYRYEEDPLKGAKAIQEIETDTDLENTVNYEARLKYDTKNNVERHSDNIIFKGLTNSVNYFRVRAVSDNYRDHNGNPILSGFSPITKIDRDCILKITKSKLNPDFNTNTRQLSWNRVKNVSQYGIIIKCTNHSHQKLLQDTNLDNSVSNRINIDLSQIEDIKKIFIAVINECGQSNIIKCYSE
jgi:hypothetical protein